MSKSLTLSMSLALALGFSGASFAGHGDCATCGIASPQGVASPQASAQGYETCDTCAPAKKHHFSMPKLSMPSCLKPKPKMYTYEWVLKKKRVHGHAATASCDTCGTAVTPSAQYSSPQATYAAPQASYAPAAYGAPQAYGASQTPSYLPTAETKPAPTGDSVPAAPAAPAPAAPTPPAPSGAQSSLLFLAPAGN
jgi:hypothetical protein